MEEYREKIIAIVNRIADFATMKRLYDLIERFESVFIK